GALHRWWRRGQRNSRSPRVRREAACLDWSLATSEGEAQDAALRMAWIVVAAGDFEAADLEATGGQGARLREALTLECADVHAGNAGYRLRCGVERAEQDGLAEGEAVGVEDAAAAVGQIASAEDIREFTGDIG